MEANQTTEKTKNEMYQDTIIGLCRLSGSGCTYLLSAIENNTRYINNEKFNTISTKLSKYIKESLNIGEDNDCEISLLQDGGNKLRESSKDGAILARRCIEEIYNEKLKAPINGMLRTIYILDSLKNKRYCIRQSTK